MTTAPLPADSQEPEESDEIAQRPGALPHTVAAITPGAARKRYRPRIDYELIACGLHGHVIVGQDVAEVRPADADVLRDYGGLRWHRCLRCDAWIVQEAPAKPTSQYLPAIVELDIPVRGRRLRDRYVLRLIVLERLLHALVFAALAAAIFAFATNADHLQHIWKKILTGLQPYSGSWIVQDVNKLFALSHLKLYLFGVAASAYVAILLIECVGLWSAKRWAEYLTFVELALFVPFELYELANSITPLKVATLVLNLAILLYLLLVHRLFGVRGGVRAARAAYGDEG
ncbi:MAG TPA: DUF2127 domain-containing protein [Acidimicrobiales bacterium]|nr:DUF2127 domain-containing protein [Acidimicrobiales bacterium]